jgi:hypothetical protein
MALAEINIGNIVNDGLGDDLRSAFLKVNENFTTLNEQLTITASNFPGTGIGIFKEKNNTDLVFKKLITGTKMLLDDTGNSIIINAAVDDAFTRFETESGNVLANDFRAVTLEGVTAPGNTTGRRDIEVTALGSTISFKNIIPVTDILTTYDFGYINGTVNNVIQALYSTANMDFGTINIPGRVSLDCGNIV